MVVLALLMDGKWDTFHVLMAFCESMDVSLK